MLKQLTLRNFRGFQDHTVELPAFCLLMGQNNAGKTTIIEALRIIGAAQAKAAQAQFISAPDWLAPNITGAVFRLSLDLIGFEHDTVHHRYDKTTPAILIAELTNRCKITVAIGEEENEVFCQLAEPGDNKVHSRAVSQSQKFGSTRVMPPIGQLLLHESPIREDYMRKNLVSFRAHRHLRNQMYRNDAAFKKFKQLIEESWHLLQIGTFTLENTEHGQEYKLMVRDGPFVSEVGQQGSGLQAWFQTLWFSASVSPEATLVLDEPDIYLHADLQRKLLKILSKLTLKQVVIATHSVEMLSDVSFDEVVVVRKREGRSKPLKSKQELQRAADSIGSIHNLQLSKLANDGSLLFVEGKDKAFLSEIAYKIGPRFFDKFVAVPTFPVGGFNNWPRAQHTAEAFGLASDGKIKSVLILDRDYKGQKELDDVILECAKSKLSVTFWRKKEIENFFLNPEFIARAINRSADQPITPDAISDYLDEIIEELALELEGQVAEAIRSNNRKLDIPSALKLAKALIAERYKQGCSASDMVSGKEVFRRLSKSLQEGLGISINPMAVCRAAKLEELDKQICDAVRQLVA